MPIESKRIAQAYDLQPSVHCPKCHSNMPGHSVHYVQRVPNFVYECAQCGASFALVPVTTYQLCELVPDTWAKHPQEG